MKQWYTSHSATKKKRNMSLDKANIQAKIKEGFSGIVQIWIDEVALCVKDPGTLMFFIIAPLFYPILYSYLYNKEETPDVPVVVVDHDNSQFSREFTRMVDATKEVKVAGKCVSLEEARKAIAERDAYGIMEIPKDFHKDIVRSKQTCVHLYCDMTSLMYYKSLLLGVTSTSLKTNADIQTQTVAEKTAREQELTATPLKYNNIALFNTQNGYASYLVPGVLVLIVQQMLLLGVGMAAGTMRDKNGNRRLIPGHDYCRGTLRNICGKSACYTMIWLLAAIFLFMGVPHIFGLPQLMRFTDSLSLIVPYVLACVFFAMTLSLLIKEREAAFVVFVFTSVIFLFASGMSWPWAAMSTGWQTMVKILPSTFGIKGFLALNSTGSSVADASPYIIGLWIQTGIYFCTTYILYRIEVRKTFAST